MDPNNFYKKTEQYVTELFNNNKDPALIFHNLGHTKSVVDRTKEIAGHYLLNENDMLAIYIAAWFHDTGYLYSEPEFHEVKSVELMREFMKGYSHDEKLNDTIESCILSTRLHHVPADLLEQILCDADTYHFGTKEFKDTNHKVFEEYNLKGNSLNEKEWAVKTIEMLNAHQFIQSIARIF